MAEQDMFSASAAAAGGGPDGPPDVAIAKYLRQSRPWAFVVAGVFALGTAGLFAMGGVAMLGGLAGAAAATDDAAAPFGAMMAAVGGIYLLMGAIYFVPAWFIGRFAFASDVRDLQGAAEAMRHQRNVWRMFGGLIVGTLLLYCLAVGMIVSVGTAMSTLIPKELLEQQP